MTHDSLAGETPAAAPRFQQLALDHIDADPRQPRKHFDAEAMRSLAESIKAQGLIQPIVVRPDEEGQFQIVAGERRWRAARQAGLQQVPVLVRDDLVGKDVQILQALENLQREDLTLAEESECVAKLVEAFGVANTAAQLGKTEAWVSRHAGVVKLPDSIKKLVGEGKIDSVDVAKDLGALMEISPKKAEAFIQRIDPESRPGADDGDEDDHTPDDDDTVWVNGVHKKWKDLTADEREAHELGQRRYADRSRPTRSEIRLQLVEAKVQKHRTQAKREEKKAERAAVKADPKAAAAAAKKASAEQNKKDREQARRKQIEQLNKTCEARAHDLTRKLNVTAGFKEPTRHTYGWHGDPRIQVNGARYYEGDKTIPADDTTARYSVKVDGTFAEIEKCSKLLEPEPKLSVRFHGELTIVEAKKLATILGSRVRFGMGFDRAGSTLIKLTEGGPKPAKPAAAAKSEAAKAGGANNGATEVAAFLKARVKKAAIPMRRISSTDLYAAYVTWCKAEGHVAIPIRSKVWAQTIEAAGIKRVRSDGMWYVGIELVKA